MSAKTTSLDIEKGKWSVLDIAHFFPISEARSLNLARHGKFVDGIIRDEWNLRKIDLSLDTNIRMSRFRTIDMLDVGTVEIMNPAHRRFRLGAVQSRPKTIDLVPSLYIPYGALDVRREVPYPKINTYPDLFARKLPYGLLAKRAYKWARSLYFKHRRRALVSVLGVAVFSVPMLSYVAYSINHGYNTLESITRTHDAATIRNMIHSARGDFERSSFLLAPFSWIPVDRVDAVAKISAGWLALTRGLDMIAQSLPADITSSGAVVKKNETDLLSYRAASRDIFLTESLGITNPTDWIAENKDTLTKAQVELATAGDMYASIVPTGARTIRAQKIWLTISRLASLLDWSLKNEKNILNILGHTNPQRFIVFNQNRDEIRTNGGFPGSILSFTLYKGNILDYHQDDVYYYDWNLFPYKEIPPPGIALLTDSYGLRDVNYYPDFRTTLDKANNFIEKSGDATIQNGIAIHQWIVEDILEKVGPVNVPGVAIPFDSQNFSRLMSTLVENKYAKENTPKDILFRFGSAFISKINEKNAPLEILDTLERYIKDGEILFASRDAEIDSFLAPYKKQLPWQWTAKNWIYPIWTSVSGNKSDRYIAREYSIKTKKLESCTYENTITLQTKHNYKTADKEELQNYFKIFGITNPEEKAKLDFIQWNGKNRAYVRVFVPIGAKIVWVGWDITTTTNENATVFSTLIETPVGATTSKSWKYTLDIPNCVNYDGSVEWTRQPWLRELTTKTN